MTEVTAQAFELKITKELPAPREDVFAAWTNPDNLKEWISPTGHGATVPLLEAREGGQYRIDMHGENETYVHTGEYLEFRPPERLVFTWISPATEQKPSVVTIDFAESADGGTLLTLTHEKLPNKETTERHLQGWTVIANQLAERL